MKGSGLEELPLVLEEPSATYSDDAQQDRRKAQLQSYKTGYNLPSDFNFRVPVLMAHKLCQVVASSPSPSWLDSMQTKQLTDQVELFLEGYHGIRVYLNIPLPFAMVQMARVFLFLYIFSMPFAIATWRFSGFVASVYHDVWFH